MLAGPSAQKSRWSHNSNQNLAKNYEDPSKMTTWHLTCNRNWTDDVHKTEVFQASSSPKSHRLNVNGWTMLRFMFGRMIWLKTSFTSYRRMPNLRWDTKQSVMFVPLNVPKTMLGSLGLIFHWEHQRIEYGQFPSSHVKNRRTIRDNAHRCSKFSGSRCGWILKKVDTWSRISERWHDRRISTLWKVWGGVINDFWTLILMLRRFFSLENCGFCGNDVSQAESWLVLGLWGINRACVDFGCAPLSKTSEPCVLTL